MPKNANVGDPDKKHSSAEKNGGIPPSRLKRLQIRHKGIYHRAPEEEELIDDTRRRNPRSPEAEKIKDILSRIHSAAISTDSKGIIISWNPGARDIFGYGEREMLGRMISDVLPLHHHIDKQSLVELKGERSDGSEIPIAFSVSAWSDTEGEQYFIFNVQDLTERKQLEEERQNRIHTENIGRLAGGIAHDFNNLLGAVMNWLNVAKMESTGGGVVEYLEEAIRSCNDAAELNQQFLTFSEEGGSPVKRTIDTRGFIIENATLSRMGSNVKVEFLDPEKELWPVEIDEVQMRRVIMNIVINAVDAMPNGGTIEVSARNEKLAPQNMQSLSPGKYVVISVRDEGCGMAEEVKSKIFVPYFTTKDDGPGHGIGLSTCYSIVDKHGGKIEVDTELNKGTTFHIYLPASDKTPSDNPRPSDMVPLQGGRILVMDDESYMRRSSSRLLEVLGYDCACASCGEEAIELYRRAMDEDKPFDVVILDITVQNGMGGEETMRELKKIDDDVRAIVYSGYAGTDVMANYRDHGFRAVLQKPFALEDLSKALFKASLSESK